MMMMMIWWWPSAPHRTAYSHWNSGRRAPPSEPTESRSDRRQTNGRAIANVNVSSRSLKSCHNCEHIKDSDDVMIWWNYFYVCVRLHFYEFYCTSCMVAYFLWLILSICLSACLSPSCLWAMLPDLNKMMMMIMFEVLVMMIIIT